MVWQRLCSEAELKASAHVSRTIGKASVIAFWRDGDPRVYADLCSHQAIPLSAFGEVYEDSILCHAHGAVFSLADGSVQREPACKPLQAYAVERRGGEVWVELEA